LEVRSLSYVLFHVSLSFIFAVLWVGGGGGRTEEDDAGESIA